MTPNEITSEIFGLKEQFKNLDQQHEASTQGMWIFLATEVLFFGGMFLAYALYRRTYPEDFVAMSQQFSWLYGTINTAVLLTSSLTMALAVRAAQEGKNRLLSIYLSITLLLGVAFLTIKGFEYAEDFKKDLLFGHVPGHMQILLFLYYLMTAVHALHLIIGIVLVAIMAVKARKNSFSIHYYSPIEVTGLYWHFVDIIWVFLYPLLYLIGKPIL
jgi:cytochrome c oxidase subunit 3